MMDDVAVRAELVQALKADLVGPFDAATGQEVLPLAPSRWYLTGFLAPQHGAAPDRDDPDTEGELANGTEGQAEDAGTTDPEPKRRQYFPSSLGLSVFLPPPADDAKDVIEVDVEYADYVKVEINEDREDKKRTGWKRVPYGPRRISVPLNRSLLGSEGVLVPDSSGIRIRGELSDTEMDGLPPGARVLSLFLVNQRTPLSQDKDMSFVFQVRMSLYHKPHFLPRPNRQGEDSNEPDPPVLALQFREHYEYAVGHNTSVITPVPDGDGQVRRLQTTQLPTYEVRRVNHEEFVGVETGMKRLSELAGDEFSTALAGLGDAYDQWITQQRQTELPRIAQQQTRDTLMNAADDARERITAGIALLESDAQVHAAFTLANLAMHASARQADNMREDHRYVNGKQPQWWPFQLAFILMNLASIADTAHPERKIADLIYFPTGGGKTEAYLGLIAFTLILRRLRGKERPDEGRGTAVILRYTLRLLTLDQLGRAATLMCALDEIRRRDPKRLGNSRFTVGLWVGKSATANRLNDLAAALNDHSFGQKGTPFPLGDCPWCGEVIKSRNIKMVDDAGKPSKTRYTRAVVYCDGPRCCFSEREREGQGLPVLFVDDQIYQEVPDFIVATVDKFAMLPWRAQAGMLFGRATHLDDRRAYGVMDKPPSGCISLAEGLLPPELIVQDELHLISGPLGTMVGLYEVALDYLCERVVGGIRYVPKVVCSTATVRRARAQIQALFNRDIAIFPPRGMNDGDNFFAITKKDEDGRLYVGIAAPGRALRAVSVRTYACVLAAAQKHFDPKGAPEQPADPYMTLVGYFNSLRELGGMRRLVEDEVRTRVSDFTRGKSPHYWVGAHPWAADRNLTMPEELTSREHTDRVKETKDRLNVRRAVGKKGDPNELKPLDTVLASNMISVGLDVDRLGLMVVTGQPKTASEYIQATSRVGRRYAGLVLVCLNVNRPRDRSHYERFSAFHHSFYRDVEATSVTPFSIQTLDRGMAGSLIAMLRHGIGEMQPPRGIMKLHDNRARAEEILECFITRGREHRDWRGDRKSETRIENDLRQRGRKFLDAWEKVMNRASEGAAERTYSKFDRTKDQGQPVMYLATDDEPTDHDEKRFRAPTSMRDVEPETHLWLRFAPLDQG